MNIAEIASSPVEVSGWDEDKLFFVETSQLAWNDLAGKHITLQHDLPDGSLIFLRLLHCSDSHSSLPAAYEAYFIGYDFHGSNQFALLPALPRYPVSPYSIN